MTEDMHDGCIVCTALHMSAEVGFDPMQGKGERQKREGVYVQDHDTLCNAMLCEPLLRRASLAMQQLLLTIVYSAQHCCG